MKILEALREGKQVIVSGMWIFQGTHMECTEGPQCCSDDYSNIEETAGRVMEYGDHDLGEVEIWP